MQSEAEDLLRSRPLFLGRARSLQEAFVEDVAGEPREALQFCQAVTRTLFSSCSVCGWVPERVEGF